MDIGTLPGGGVYTPRDVISFKGALSSAIGIVVTALPDYVIPDERVSFITVPGRNGPLTQREGTDVFNDLTLTVSCYCPEPTPENISNIARYFRGNGRLRLPNRPGGWYEATVMNQIPFKQVLRGSTPRVFDVNFRCNPLFYLDEGETEISLANGDFLVNPTGYTAHPVIEIRGSGDMSITVGTQTVQLTGIDGGIILDGRLQEAYWDGMLENSKMSGPFPVIGEGSIPVTWTGGVTGVMVTPNWVKI